MIKALGSRIDLTNVANDVASDYLNCVEDLLFTPEVTRLADFDQHMHISRLQHSINVSYYSYLLCKKLRLNYRSAARAGLLHDLFFYDREEQGMDGFTHVALHPVAALKNAMKLTELTEMEKDIIVRHMWPCDPSLPRFKESLIVSCVDKYCAVGEFSDYIRMFFMGKNVRILARASQTMASFDSNMY